MTFWPDIAGQEYVRHRGFWTLKSDPATAGDQTKIVLADPPYVYRVGWRTLTKAQAMALMLAYQRSGDAGLYFLEWRSLAETNLVIGTGTGSGTLTLDLKCRLTGDSVVGSGLVITKNGTPTTGFSVVSDTGTHYTQSQVAITDNTAGATYRATWTSARRRRHVRARTPIIPAPRGNTGLWIARGEFEETDV